MDLGMTKLMCAAAPVCGKPLSPPTPPPPPLQLHEVGSYGQLSELHRRKSLKPKPYTLKP